MTICVEPPSNFDLLKEAQNMYYYSTLKDDNSFVIDIRVWANDTVHIWTPMTAAWKAYSIEEYKEIKGFIECI